MSRKSELDAILLVMGQNVQEPKRIPQSDIKDWMKSTDIEVLGALFDLLSRYYPRIDPTLSFDDYYQFALHYYERCFCENPEGEWSDSSYEAGWSFVKWFIGLWNDPKTSQETFQDLKSFLAKLYKNGDENLRTCIINATLEHLFENQKIAQYFIDWENDEILKVAYAAAIEWGKKEWL